MTKKNSTEIVFILDRSGSMAPTVSDMVGGFERLIKEQATVAGECKVTLTQFDNEYEVVYSGVPIDKVPLPLVLDPRGMTALLDAIGKTVTDLGNRLKNTAEAERPSKVIVAIITDGHENCSKEYSHLAVQKMIKHQQEKYSWEFVFLGAALDAVSVAKDLLIHNAASFQNNTIGNAALWGSVSSSIGSSRTSGGPVVYDQGTYNAALNNGDKSKS